MNPRQQFEERLHAALGELRGAGLLRQMRLPAGIDLVSNDYLGLAEHPGLIAAMRHALDTLPAGSGGSRLLRGHHDVFEEIEDRLADFCACEAALLFGSGYAANIGLLQAIAGPDDVIFSDERNHASLIDGIRLSRASVVVYPHQDLDALDARLRASGGANRIVITESVFSMDGDLTPLCELADLCDRHDAVLVVDEAHATGLYGARGSGRVEELGLRDRVLATIHTGGKALGSAGAWVAGSQVLRDVILNRARTFIFSTAPLPVLAPALGAALDAIRDEPHRRAEVHRKSVLLRRALHAHGVHVGGTSPILPVIVGTNEAAIAVQGALMASGFDVRAIRPPSVAPGTARLRVTVRFPVSDDDLLRFAAVAGPLLQTALAAPRRVPAS